MKFPDTGRRGQKMFNLRDVDASHILRLISHCHLIDTLGFETHARQVRERRGEKIPPIWYKRPFFYELGLTHDKIKGNGDIIEIPPFEEKADYEFEIAGLFLDDVRTESVADAIEIMKTKMLFTIMNDVSARDLQAEDVQLPLSVSPSKGVLPKVFGPRWIPGSELLLDENGVPDMSMRLSVNGSIRCEDNFRSIYFTDPETAEKRCFGFAQVIAWFGKHDRGFKRGWILGSGTIGDGSILEDARYPWLKDGDIVIMEAEHIGTLENIFKLKTAP